MERDDEFMRIALDCAREGLAKGNLPVGAVLVLNGEIIDRAHNSNYVNGNMNSHAEKTVVDRQARAIHSSKQEGSSRVELFATWEPCLMCLGASVLNRVDRIVYACPDPTGGTSHLTYDIIGRGYKKLWPTITPHTTFREESYDLLVPYMISKAPRWDTMVEEMRRIRADWSS